MRSWPGFKEHGVAESSENYTSTVIFPDNVRLTDWPTKQLTDKQTDRLTGSQVGTQTDRLTDRQAGTQTDWLTDTAIQTDGWTLSSPLSWLQFGRMRPSCVPTISWHCADSSSSTCFTSNQQVWFTLLESDVFTSVTWTRNSTKFLLNCRGWRIQNNTVGFLHLEGEGYVPPVCIW